MFSRLLAAFADHKKAVARSDDASAKQSAQVAQAAQAAQQRAHRLFDSGDHAAARAAYDQLISADAAPGLLVNRGYCELMLGEADTARESFRAALARAPHLAEAWVGLGDIAAQHNQHAEALRCYDSALALNAALLVARNNRAQSLLALGRLEEAWRESETRFALPNAATLYPHRLALPRWDGATAARVLVHWEQGFGDIIQHLRFLPQVATRLHGTGAACAFECPPPLARLVRRMPGAPPLIEASNSAPDSSGFDCCAALLSLPLLLGANANKLPLPPYLQADVSRARALRAAWQQDKTPLLVGLAWRASAFDARRSLALADLLEALLTTRSDMRLVSLQKDITEAERALLTRHDAIDAGSMFNDFDDTAAALAALDSVICVDTAVAHLAGALARPVSLLLNEPAATRWMLARTDTPWYPSMRLYRKRAEQAWAPLLKQAAAALPTSPSAPILK